MLLCISVSVMFGMSGSVCCEYVDCLCCVGMYVGQCQCDCL